MTNSGDNGPVAPRRSLGKPGNQSTSRQPVMTPPYGASTQSYTPSNAEKGMTFPVPAASEEPGRHQSTSTGEATTPTPTRTSSPDKAAEKAARRAAANRPRQTRRAKLRLTRVDPWSVTKTAFLLSIAFGIMCVVAVFLVFSIMSAAGLWDHVNSVIQGVINQKTDPFDITEYVGMSRVMGITMLIAAVDVVLITALATLGAFIYNMSASMLGGIEVTLAEDLK